MLWNVFSDEYVDSEYITPNCNICDMYVKDEYYNKEKQLNENEIFHTSEGYSFNQPNIFEIKTDNKFIFSITLMTALLLKIGMKILKLF